MTAIKTNIHNGWIQLPAPADWPEGSEVVIQLAAASVEAGPIRGMSEEEQADDPESVARWIAALEAIPPLHMTAEEEAAWRTERQEQRAWELASFEERAERVQRELE
jgi:hypothetical protein